MYINHLRFLEPKVTDYTKDLREGIQGALICLCKYSQDSCSASLEHKRDGQLVQNS